MSSGRIGGRNDIVVEWKKIRIWKVTKMLRVGNERRSDRRGKTGYIETTHTKENTENTGMKFL